MGTGYVFDDITSIVPLYRLREQPELFFPFVFSDLSGPLGRPVSIATFAAEQAVLQAGPEQSQLLSIALHGVNTVLVFLLTQKIFRLAHSPAPAFFALFAFLRISTFSRSLFRKSCENHTFCRVFRAARPRSRVRFFAVFARSLCKKVFKTTRFRALFAFPRPRHGLLVLLRPF